MANKLRSDAALRRVIDIDSGSHREQRTGINVSLSGAIGDPIVEFYVDDGDTLIAEIRVKDVIAKRASLRGVNARLKAAIRPKKAAKKKRK